MAGVEHVPQAAAAQQLEDEEGGAAVLTPVVDADDVGVLEGGDGLGLGPEAAEEGLVLGQCRMQDLDRDPAAQRDVVGREDSR